MRALLPLLMKIIYAGAFRGYGQIVMIEHGQDYLTLLAGLSQIDVQIGQGVLAGEPVARMGDIRAGANGAMAEGEFHIMETRLIRYRGGQCARAR